MNPALTLRLAAATLALSTLATTGCSSSDTTALAAGQAPAAPRTTVAEPSPLCTKATPGPDATDGEKVILSRGIGWTYEQTVPASYDGGTPKPLVVALGGGLSKAAGRAVGDEAIVLAVGGPADGSGWADTPGQLRFVKDLLLRAETTLCFDRAAIFVVGTNGAQPLADRVVQDMPGTVQPL